MLGQVLQYAEEVLNSQVRSKVFVALCDCRHVVLFRVERARASAAAGAIDLSISKSAVLPLTEDCSGLTLLHQFLNADWQALGFQTVHIPKHAVTEVARPWRLTHS